MTLPPLRIDAVLHADDRVAEHGGDLDGAGATEVIGLAGHRLLEAGGRRGRGAVERGARGSVPGGGRTRGAACGWRAHRAAAG